MKNNFLNIKKVNNKEVIKSLNESLELNNNAYDYILNEIARKEDILKYNENDVIVQEDYKNLKYIKYCLEFLKNSYIKSLERLKND